MADDIPTFGATARQLEHDADDERREPLRVHANVGSPLDELREEAAREIGHETVTLAVKERPGWSVRYRADVEVTTLNKWRKASSDRTMPDGVDELKLACIILANHCDCLVKNGEDLRDEDDNPVTFGSTPFMESFGVGRAIDAVKAWYASDGHIMSASQEVMIASGYGDEAEREDPTAGSSTR